jgi:hypothetical protein
LHENLGQPLDHSVHAGKETRLKDNQLSQPVHVHVDSLDKLLMGSHHAPLII